MRLIAVLVGLALLTTLSVSAQDAKDTLPLSGLGPYAVGFDIRQFVDASRDGRKLPYYIWYPALAPEQPTDKQTKMSKSGWFQAAPDLSGGPYPLILNPAAFGGSSSLTQLDMALASRGFVVVGLQHLNDFSGVAFVDRPLDVLFALDQLAAVNQSDFGGMIDTNHVGLIGTTFGAYTALALTGARVDPTSAASETAQPLKAGNSLDPRNWWPGWDWDTIAAYRATFSPSPGDGLWPPYADKRILAAVIYSPCQSRMFGANGLASGTVPLLIVAGTEFNTCPYNLDVKAIFEQLGSQDRYLLSIVNGSEMADYFAKPLLAVSTQLDAAFFGYYLRGQKDYAQYLSKANIDSDEAQLKLGLVWGEYSGQ